MSTTNQHQIMAKLRRNEAIYLSKDQLAVLENYFAHDPYPHMSLKEFIASEIKSSTDRVSTWFQNNRAKVRRDAKSNYYYTSSGERREWKKSKKCPQTVSPFQHDTQQLSSNSQTAFNDSAYSSLNDSDTSRSSYSKTAELCPATNADKSFSHATDLPIQLKPCKPLFRPYLL